MSETKKVGLLSRVGKWFREMRSELKKVTWPTLPQVINNTGIVLLMMLIVGVIIGAIDLVWENAIEWILRF
ncbi:MAG: preprotein translocase subunit SecE [Oscillospiraceae bacterium]|nr:preprotein translocase subunit SecE [Oscillospiraceae bacterium]